jgi:threonine dehydratase
MIVDDLRVYVPGGDSAIGASLYLERKFDRTPLIRVPKSLLDALSINTSGESPIADVWLKLDSVQESGTFKTRGAFYYLSRLYDNNRLPKEVVTASAGNHAQGVALAAKKYKVKAVIFMPENAPQIKVGKVKALGADVRLVGEHYDDSVMAARKFEGESGAHYFPAYEHQDIIYGQGSVAWEIFRKAKGESAPRQGVSCRVGFDIESGPLRGMLIGKAGLTFSLHPWVAAAF